jgi:hypothetical protein
MASAHSAARVATSKRRRRDDRLSVNRRVAPFGAMSSRPPRLPV